MLPKDLESSGGTIANILNDYVGHLRTLLTGHDLLDVKSRWYSILNTDRTFPLAETEAQRAQLGVFKDCRIMIKAGGLAGRNVLVEVDSISRDSSEYRFFIDARRINAVTLSRFHAELLSAFQINRLSHHLSSWSLSSTFVPRLPFLYLSNGMGKSQGHISTATQSCMWRT